MYHNPHWWSFCVNPDGVFPPTLDKMVKAGTNKERKRARRSQRTTKGLRTLLMNRGIAGIPHSGRSFTVTFTDPDVELLKPKEIPVGHFVPLSTKVESIVETRNYLAKGQAKMMKTFVKDKEDDKRQRCKNMNIARKKQRYGAAEKKRDEPLNPQMVKLFGKVKEIHGFKEPAS